LHISCCHCIHLITHLIQFEFRDNLWSRTLESAELANAQQPVEVEDTEEVVITDTNIAPRTVFFKIG